MELLLKNISVDAGLILISDINFYSKNNGTLDKKMCKFIDLENGKYIVDWEIAESWRGKVGGSGELIVESGKIVVSDPCYHFPDHDEWLKLLRKYDYLHYVPIGCLVLDSMGGDGNYDVNLIIKYNF